MVKEKKRGRPSFLTDTEKTKILEQTSKPNFPYDFSTQYGKWGSYKAIQKFFRDILKKLRGEDIGANRPSKPIIDSLKEELQLLPNRISKQNSKRLVVNFKGVPYQMHPRIGVKYSINRDGHPFQKGRNIMIVDLCYELSKKRDEVNPLLYYCVNSPYRWNDKLKPVQELKINGRFNCDLFVERINNKLKSSGIEIDVNNMVYHSFLVRPLYVADNCNRFKNSFVVTKKLTKADEIFLNRTPRNGVEQWHQENLKYRKIAAEKSDAVVVTEKEAELSLDYFQKIIQKVQPDIILFIGRSLGDLIARIYEDKFERENNYEQACFIPCKYGMISNSFTTIEDHLNAYFMERYNVVCKVVEENALLGDSTDDLTNFLIDEYTHRYYSIIKRKLAFIKDNVKKDYIDVNVFLTDLKNLIEYAIDPLNNKYKSKMKSQL